MNPSALIPFIALLCYSILLFIVARRHSRDRLSLFFSLYLLSMIIWSLGSFMMHANLGIMNTLFWNRVLVPGATGMPISFFGFVQVFLRRKQQRWLSLGVLSYIVIQIANLLGYIVQEAYVSGGLLYNRYGPALAITGTSWAFFIGYAALDLLREYRRARDILYRNRIKYLLIVVLMIFIGSLTNTTRLTVYPVDIAFNVVGALLIAYAIFRHKLLDINVVVRKGLLYSIPTAIIGAVYFLIISLAMRAFHEVTGLQVFLLSFAVALLTAVAIEPLRNRVQLWVDKLFFREKYDARLMLQRLGQRAASELDLDKLTNMILDEVTTTMHIEKAAFLLKQDRAAEFYVTAQKGLDLRDSLRLRGDHPMVSWLYGSERVLTKHDIDLIPSFRALWEEEREDLQKIGAEIFIPLRAKGELVGIFALGPKLSEEPYSQDDQLTLTTLASQTAIAIHNARLYRAAQQELTERRRAEEELKASEERYHSLFDRVPVGLYRTTPEGRILDANPALVQMLDYPGREALLKTNAADLYPSPDDRARGLSFLEREGIVRSYETRLRQHDGTVIWVRDTFRAVRNGNGRVLYYEGSLEDITERQQAQEELVRAYSAQTVINSLLHLSLGDKPLDELLGHALDAIFLTLSSTLESKGVIFLVERAPETLVMKVSKGLDGSVRTACAQVPFGRCLCGQTAATQEIQIADGLDDRHEICHEGMTTHGHCCIPILFGDRTIGLINLYLKEGHHIDQKEQEFLAAVANALAGIIIRRQAEVEREEMQVQLLQAQKMEAVGRLAGGVAHDFNNILTAIISCSEFLLQDLGPDDYRRKDAEEIKKAGERAASLTRQLLAFSRRQYLQPQLINLNDVVLDIGKMLQRLMGENIKMTTGLDPALEAVKADAGQIEQVIINLAINARDAMPEGGKLTIRTENVILDELRSRSISGARPGKFICLSVEDTGIGMDAQTMQHLFEPFFTTKEVGKGTGLGLAVVYGIVTQHEGWINVYSEPGRGSVFRVYLPAFPIEGEVEVQEEDRARALQGLGERVLLVEDEESVRDVVQRTLIQNGYLVLAAANALEAQAIFEREGGNFALLFSDIILPGKSGVQLAEELLLRKPGLRVLLSSGYTEREPYWAKLEGKEFRFLQKPYAVGDLLLAVKEAIEPTLSLTLVRK